MEIQFKTYQQRLIADQLWIAETEDDVNHILETYGTEAVVVKEMMVADFWDKEVVTDVRTTRRLLKKLKLIK